MFLFTILVHNSFNFNLLGPRSLQKSMKVNSGDDKKIMFAFHTGKLCGF